MIKKNFFEWMGLVFSELILGGVSFRFLQGGLYFSLIGPKPDEISSATLFMASFFFLLLTAYLPEIFFDKNKNTKGKYK